MRRLYLQIYAAFLGILLLFGALVTVASLLLPIHPQEPPAPRCVGQCPQRALARTRSTR